MSITDDQLTTLRAMVGDAKPPTDLDLEDAYDRLGTIDNVAHEVLNNRLQNYLSSPDFSVTGYSENKSSVINGLRDQLKAIDARLALTDTSVTAGQSVTSFPVTRLQPRR